MHVELVRCKTSDGLRLDGALVLASQDSNTKVADSLGRGAVCNSDADIDGVILLHGVGSNFYSSTMMDAICVGLQQMGISTLRVNTRGHDGVSTVATDAGGQVCGAAYEIVDDCRHDVIAWIQLLTERGCRNIGLLGHSLGALKILYAQAAQPHPAVQKLIAISPPRLSYARFQVGQAATSFRSSWKTARSWIDSGQPRMLFLASFPFSLVLSAATFVDKYGPEERYNLLSFASRIQQPVEFVFGAQELSSEQPAFDGITDELIALPWPQVPKIEVIPGANHFYAGCVPQLVDHVVQATQRTTHTNTPPAVGP